MITVPPNKSTLVLALWVSYTVNQTLRLCAPGAEIPMWGSPQTLLLPGPPAVQGGSGVLLPPEAGG